MMRATCVVAMVVVASSAWGGKKTVVIAGGDCSDAGLIAGAKDFRDAASREFGGELMEAEVVLDIVRPRATRSLSDVERQVESARTLFFGGQVDRAEQLVDRALEELERASPETKPWPVTQSALVLKALIAKNLDRSKDMAEALRRIARIDPAFKLDPDAHPPSAIAALDAVKKELARTRKTQVTIRVEAGPVGTVFLDGQPMGQTPLKLDLVPGTYRVAVTSGAMVSFPHKLDVPRDSKLSVDLAFEGSISTQAPLCIAGGSDASAVKLAQLVAAENVILLRNNARRGDPTVLSGTLFDLATNKQERAGSVRAEFIPALARFLVTGKEQVGVDPTAGVASKSEPAAPTKVEAKVVEPAKVEPKKVEAKSVSDAPKSASDAPKVVTARSEPTLTTPTRPVALTTLASPPLSAGRTASFVVIGLGVASLVAGSLVFLSGDLPAAGEELGLRSRYAQITPGGVLPPAASNAGKEALEKMHAIDANNTASFTLLGAGVGLVAGGVIGLMLFPSAPAQVAVVPTPSGGAALLSGRF